MKMNILGVLAIAIAISLSAFTSPTNPTKKGSGDYWFLITGSIPVTSKVPPADATFIQQSDTAPEEDCNSGSDQCVSGFTASQVNTMTDKLNGSQLPDDVSQTQH